MCWCTIKSPLASHGGSHLNDPWLTLGGKFVSTISKQEYIPIGCVPLAFYRTGVSLDRDGPGQRPPRQRLFDRDISLDIDIHSGAKPPLDRQTPVKTLPSWFKLIQIFMSESTQKPINWFTRMARKKNLPPTALLLVTCHVKWQSWFRWQRIWVTKNLFLTPWFVRV